MVERINKGFLGKWKIRKETIQKMKDLTQDTMNTGFENGGLLCGNSNKKEIKLESVCKGSNCRVNIRDNECKNKNEFMGVFHSHKTHNNLSIRDIHVFRNEKDLFGCLGSPKEEKPNINCFKYKNHIDDNEVKKMDKRLDVELKMEDNLINIENTGEYNKKGDPFAIETPKHFISTAKVLDELSTLWQKKYLKSIDPEKDDIEFL